MRGESERWKIHPCVQSAYSMRHCKSHSIRFHRLALRRRQPPSPKRQSWLSRTCPNHFPTLPAPQGCTDPACVLLSPFDANLCRRLSPSQRSGKGAARCLSIFMPRTRAETLVTSLERPRLRPGGATSRDISAEVLLEQRNLTHSPTSAAPRVATPCPSLHESSPLAERLSRSSAASWPIAAGNVRVWTPERGVRLGRATGEGGDRGMLLRSTAGDEKKDAVTDHRCVVGGHATAAPRRPSNSPLSVASYLKWSLQERVHLRVSSR